MAQSKLYKTKDQKNRTLVMFSGGLDSTAALWHVLNRPKKYGDIHVHHIHIQNMENRWRAEAAAVKAVLAYMRENVTTEFTTSESTICTPQFGNKFLFDTEITGYIAGYMTSRDQHINKVVLGATATDFALGASQSAARGNRLLNAFYEDGKEHAKTLKEYPHVDLDKAAVYKTMPADLALLTWSCRRPRYIDGKPVECGTCKTCLLEMHNVKKSKTTRKIS